jgi:PAS domain S-box/PAS domain S-box
MMASRERAKAGSARMRIGGDALVSRLMARIGALEAAQIKAQRAQEDLLAATEALRRSEERYALAMKGPNEGLWDWDPITKDLYLSARLLSILGFPSASLHTTSHEWLKLVHPDDRQPYQAKLVDHMKGRTGHFECEYRVRDQGGDYRWVLARGLVVRDASGRATRMVGSIGDITERKRGEAVLQASESRFRSLVGAAASAIVMTDGLGHIREFNREAETIFGIARAAAIDRHWTQVLGTVPLAALMSAAHAGEEVRDRELAVKAPGQPVRVVSWTLARSDDAADAGIIAVGTDVTRRADAERALHEANEMLEVRVAERTREAQAAREQAELANRAKSEFVANMSHELRTPLNAIIGFSEAMSLEVMGRLDNPVYVDYVAAIHESGIHLLEVINDILDLAKIEAGKFELHREDSDLHAIIQGALRLTAERAEKASVALEWRLADDMGSAFIDPLRIKQVLLNLLSNAVKFTPEGGRVCLDARLDGRHARIEVGDSGIGMDAAAVEKALQPFGQVDSSLARRYPGTGLGLPLSKSFVALHGGSLQVHSAPGRGTTVTVLLPV